MRKFNYYFIICILSFVVLYSGCASLKEAGKGILGISTNCLLYTSDAADE